MEAKGALVGRRILITGAASGIGAATARLFHEAGATLALADMDGDAAKAIAAELGASAVQMDVRQEGSVTRSLAEAVLALGGLDGLVNAAGVAGMTRLEDTTLETWSRQIDTNLTGVFLVCRGAAPHLRAAASATIVNVASASGISPSAAGVAYSASKAGVIMLGKVLARELGPSVRVNSVCPGMVETPMFTRHFPVRTPEFETMLAADYVQGRLGQPEEIARLILFLTSSDSSFITGDAIAVDGGRVFH